MTETHGKTSQPLFARECDRFTVEYELSPTVRSALNFDGSPTEALIAWAEHFGRCFFCSEPGGKPRGELISFASAVLEFAGSEDPIEIVAAEPRN